MPEQPPFPPARLAVRVYLAVAAALAGASALTAALHARPAWFEALIRSPALWVVLVGWVILSAILGSGWRAPTIAGSLVVLGALAACSAVMLAGALWTFTGVSVARGLAASAAVFALASLVGAVTGFDMVKLRRAFGPLSTAVTLLFGYHGGAPQPGLFGFIEAGMAVAVACVGVAASAQTLYDAGRITPRGELALRTAQHAVATYFELVDMASVVVVLLGQLRPGNRVRSPRRR